MAGIFGIFNDSTNVTSGSLNRIKEKSFAGGSSKFKSAENAVLPSKGFVPSQVKPKGLSIRSKSDLNISITNTSTGTNKSKSKECLKPQEKPASFNKHSLSPFKMKTPKSKSIANITPKKLSPKISSPIMQIDHHVFKKPATPIKLKKQYEPEKLAYDFNDYKFMNEQMQNIFIHELTFLRNARKCDSLNESTISLEDEGFISDPELDLSQDQSHCTSLSSCLNDIQLPDLSDFED